MDRDRVSVCVCVWRVSPFAWFFLGCFVFFLFVCLFGRANTLLLCSLVRLIGYSRIDVNFRMASAFMSSGRCNLIAKLDSSWIRDVISRPFEL